MDYCTCNDLNGKSHSGDVLEDCNICYNPSSYCTCDKNLNLEKILSAEDISSSGDYRVLDNTGILKQRNYAINSIATINYNLSVEEATLILIYFRWSKDSFDLNWWDKQDEIRINCGLAMSKKSILDLKSLNIPDSSKFCLICYDDQDLFALSCKHHFCKVCWVDYLKYKTDDFLVSLSTTCPQQHCPLIVPETLFTKYLTCYDQNSKLENKLNIYQRELNNFQKSIIRNYISTSKTLKTCPSPDCTYIIENYSGKAIEIKCLCGYRFCFGCEKMSHRPISCSLLSKWDEKHSKDSADDLWIKANCKICPHCKQSIERSTGCLYMLCAKNAGGCGKAFCYVCETDWAKHTQDHFTCNKYTPSVQNKEDEASMIKEELKRMEHYYARFTNFKVSQAMAVKLKPKIEEKQQELIELGIPYTDLNFLHEALDCIILTNNTIKNTYIFGYYLSECSEKTLFEYNQGMLEKNSDSLYKLVDVDLNNIIENGKKLGKDGHKEFLKTFNELKLKAVNFSSTSLKFQDNVNNYVEKPEMIALLDLECKKRKYKPKPKDPKQQGHYKYLNEA